MKKITTLFTMLLLVAAICSSNQAKAQLSCASWAKKGGGSNEDAGKAVATDHNGNVYYVGDFYSISAVFGTTTLHNQAYADTSIGAEMFLVKYDSCGNFIWAKQAGGRYDVIATGIATDAAGNIYVSGYHNCDTAYFGGSVKLAGSYYNAFVVKYNTNGVAQWAKQGVGNDASKARAVTVDANNNVYITGYFNCDTLRFGSTELYNGYSGNSFDIFTAKFDNSGNIQWVKGGTGDSQDLGYGISTDAAGNVYVAGTFGSSYIRFGTDSLILKGYNDIFVVKYDMNGAVQWLRTAGDTDDDEAYGIATDAAGNSYVTGYIGYSSTVSFGSHSITNSTPSQSMFIVKYDVNGADQWARCSQQDYYSFTQGMSVSLDAGGNPNVIGSYTSDSLTMGPVHLYNQSLLNVTGDSIHDIFVAKYKASTGYLSWARSAGGSGHDFGNGIATGPNNSLYITGEFMSPSVSFAGITCTLTAASTTQTGDAFITNNISSLLVSPDICLVSDDSIIGLKEYNVVYWNKTTYPTATSFIVYREAATGVFIKIASQPYSALSLFVDTVRSIPNVPNGDPTVGAYKYALQIMDTSGTYSLLGNYHNTVYFQHNVGSGTFTWNSYVVAPVTALSNTTTPVTNFELMRDDNSTGNWNSIAIISGSQTSITDPNYSTYATTASWRVDADGFSCTPTLRLASGGNNTMVAKIKSHSNQNNNRQSGIKQLLNSSQVNIYPNPTKGSFIIETTATEKQSVQVFDVNGKLVFSQTINGNANIDASNLSDGVYNVSIIGNEGVVNKRLVIVK
ncbi:MAG TPA: SBBP repeat-containing protein [Bacteroidia bacterium]|nr:SBBP repeat-containing protein [Bacteroidia bacterium]